MESKSKYLKDNNFLAEHDNDDWCDGIGKNRSLREIAYQLKRIADKLCTEDKQ